MAPKAIRNTTGKPVTVENLDRRLAIRHAKSLESVSADTSTRSKTAEMQRDPGMRKLDRQYEPNKLAQAERESDNNFPSED